MAAFLRRVECSSSGGEVNRLIDWFGEGLQPSILRMVIWPEVSSTQNSMAAVSADGSTVLVFRRGSYGPLLTPQPSPPPRSLPPSRG